MTAAATASPEPGEGRGFALPSAYTILFVLIVIMAALTYVIPAGKYDLNADGEPIPGSYHRVDQNPQRILVDSLLAPINGLYGIEGEDGSISVWNSGELFGAIDVALFILVIGGFLGVTMKTGAIQAGIGRIVSRLIGRERLMIPILMIVFAIGGTTYGMAEESLAFYALIITVMIAAGYDSLVAASILLLGCGIGVLGSTINPFATGIASGFAGVSIEEGIVGRLVILIVGTAIGIVFVMRYAARVRADPTASLVYSVKAENEAQFQTAETDEEKAGMTGAQKIVLLLFALAFVTMIYGVIPWEDLGIGLPTLWWWFPEMTASFLFFTILIGLVARMSENSFTGTFVDGARDLLGVALIIGIARGITVIMTNGLITDTVLNCGRAGGRRPRRRRVHQPDVRAVPATVLPDPVVIGSRDGRDADHGAPRQLRRCSGAVRRDRISERQRPHQPRDADVRCRHGRPGDLPRRVRDLAEVRLAGPAPARDSHDHCPDRFGAVVNRPPSAMPASEEST